MRKILFFLLTALATLSAIGVAYARPAPDRPAYVSPSAATTLPAHVAWDTCPADVTISPHTLLGVQFTSSNKLPGSCGIFADNRARDSADAAMFATLSMTTDHQANASYLKPRGEGYYGGERKLQFLGGSNDTANMGFLTPSPS